MDTPNLNELTNLTNSQRANTNTLLGNQAGQQSDFLKRYTGAVQGQEGQAAMAQRIGQELGVPTLQKNATMLRNTLTNLPSTYSKATTGYDVNANQLSRIIGQKSSELSPMVQTAETSLGNAQNTMNTQMGYATADQAKQLMPYQTEQSLMQDRQAREASMYSQDNQNELNSLINKIQYGVQLSEGEKNRANALAVAENNYQNNLKLQQNQPAETQIVESGGKKYLINSQTGSVINTYGGSTPAPKTAGSYLGVATGLNGQTLGINTGTSSLVTKLKY